MLKHLAILTALILPLHAGETFSYEADDFSAKGYLALPEGASAEAKSPGILVVPEWWGLNDYAKTRADQLAQLGYVALAVDMYGGGKTTDNPEEAGKMAKEASSDPEVLKARFFAGMKALQARDEVDAQRVASIGYCFGGRVSLQMALYDIKDLNGVVSFHGSLNDFVYPEEDAVLKTRMLVCHGSDDDFIADDDLQTFITKSVQHDAPLHFVSYPNAVHAFTNPAATDMGDKFGINIAYNKAADLQSWDDMKNFFTRLFPELPLEKP